jgi:hypothetical protein
VTNYGVSNPEIGILVTAINGREKIKDWKIEWIYDTNGKLLKK